MRRVAVIGGSCTGKTTIARELARRLGVPHVELDALFWEPNWQEASTEDFRARVNEALAPDGWVVDGNYHGRLGTIVLERADTAVFLDLPFRTVLRRVLARTLRRAVTREEMWNGNRESFRTVVSRDSIIWWVVTMHRTYREKWPPRLAPLTHLRVVHLRSARETRRWLQSVEGDVAPRPECAPSPTPTRSG